MHGTLEAGKEPVSKALSPVRWRKAFAEKMIGAGRTQPQQASSWLIATMIFVALATTLFVFVALP
jgi:hypothetical protein